MSMTDRSTPYADHPAWCTAPFCESADPFQRRHSTVPVLIRNMPFDDREVTVSRERDDEFGPKDPRWITGADGVALHIRGEDESHVEAFMPRDSVRRLIEALQDLDAAIWGDVDTTPGGAR